MPQRASSHPDRPSAPASKPETVRYAFFRSPLGRVGVAISPRGVCRVSLAARRDGPFLEEVKRISGGLPVLRDPKAIVAAHREISQYLRGRRTRFTLHADLAGMTPFQRLVLDATARIPHGRVASYGEIARAIGRPGAARAVGQALSVNPVPLVVPCHRVIASNGRLGGFTVGGNPSGVGVKRRLLELERAIPPAPPR